MPYAYAHLPDIVPHDKRLRGTSSLLQVRNADLKDFHEQIAFITATEGP